MTKECDAENVWQGETVITECGYYIVFTEEGWQQWLAMYEKLIK